jgi:hypothetical protein
MIGHSRSRGPAPGRGRSRGLVLGRGCGRGLGNVPCPDPMVGHGPGFAVGRRGRHDFTATASERLFHVGFGILLAVPGVVPGTGWRAIIVVTSVVVYTGRGGTRRVAFAGAVAFVVNLMVCGAGAVAFVVWGAVMH